MIFEDQLDRIVPRDQRLESPLLLPACLATHHRYRAGIGGLELEQLLRLVVLIGSMIAVKLKSAFPRAQSGGSTRNPGFSVPGYGRASYAMSFFLGAT
jgi:hypothetical protein